MRNNPYETKKQRKEREVKQLLDKVRTTLFGDEKGDIIVSTFRQIASERSSIVLFQISPSLISLDPNEINRVNTAALEEEIEKKKSILWVKDPAIEFTPRHKMRGRGGGVDGARVKQIVKGGDRFQKNKERGDMHQEIFGTENSEKKPKSVLDRFAKKK